MNDEMKCWACVRFTGGNMHIMTASIARTRKESIVEFLTESDHDWRFWRKTMNWQCKKIVIKLK